MPEMRASSTSTARLNSTLDGAFLDWVIINRLPDARIFLGIAIFCAVLFIPLDRYALPEGENDGLLQARMVFLVSLLLLYGSTYMKPWPRAFALIYTLLFTTAGAIFITELDNSSSALFYKTAAMSYCALFIQASPILTTMFSLPAMAALALGFHINSYDNGHFHTATAAIFVWSIVSILAFASYMRDQRNLGIFNDLEELKRSDIEKKNWLFFVGRLLRHEISNQMVALNSSMALFTETSKIDSTGSLIDQGSEPKNSFEVERIRNNIQKHNLLLNQLSRASELSEFDAESVQELDLYKLLVEIGESSSSRQSEHKLVFDRPMLEESWLRAANPRSLKIAMELLFDSVFGLANQSLLEHPIFVGATPGGASITIAASNAYAKEQSESDLSTHVKITARSFPWKCAREVLGAQGIDLDLSYTEGVYLIEILSTGSAAKQAL
jgi:hypothetical protein